MPNFQQTTVVQIYMVSIEEKTLAVVSCVFLELPKMQCACVMLAEKLKGRLNLLCTFPGGHWIRENSQCGHRKAVCDFKQENLEGARWPLWK